MKELKSTRWATDEEKWAAVRRRDARADGAFVFAVKTTGVYCRPSCRSRPPRRENVVFHASCAAAERAGFRACKRCQPDGPAAAEREAAMIARACRMLEAPDASPRLGELARAVGVSPFYFHRLFKKITGVTPGGYRAAHRAGVAREKIAARRRITDAIYEAGFCSGSRFYATSRQRFGMTPRTLKRGGAGETIRFALGKCALGLALVAESAKGICAILLGDDAGRLERELRGCFPRAAVSPGDATMRGRVGEILRLLENCGPSRHLPLDIRGTAFQQKVWAALMRIPPGSTATYAEIARKIGAPKAVRAVGAACGANPLAVVVPCHRAVRTGGGLAGYRWGLERKRALLAREAAPRAE
jgi:AraC family transcriptional regulator of adaptative response/methylated-DNA-[protein]-cysteine methyltransferase